MEQGYDDPLFVEFEKDLRRSSLPQVAPDTVVAVEHEAYRDEDFVDDVYWNMQERQKVLTEVMTAFISQSSRTDPEGDPDLDAIMRMEAILTRTYRMLEYQSHMDKIEVLRARGASTDEQLDELEKLQKGEIPSGLPQVTEGTAFAVNQEYSESPNDFNTRYYDMYAQQAELSSSMMRFIKDTATDPDDARRMFTVCMVTHRMLESKAQADEMDAQFGYATPGAESNL